MFCVKCGTKLPDDALFCSKCGKAVKLSNKSGGTDFGANNVSTTNTESPGTRLEEGITVYTEDDVLEGKCPYCGYNGKLIITERIKLPAWKVVFIYALGLGAMIIIALLLEKLLVPIVPWIVLFIGGLIGTSFCFAVIKEFAKQITIRHLICPKCKKPIDYSFGKIVDMFLMW